MLKNNSLLGLVYGVLFLCIFLVFIFNFVIWKNESLIFEYPRNVSFSGELLDLDQNYDARNKFDKEFIVSSNNLYQFYLYVKRYEIYIPYIEDRLSEMWLPDDFKYLPIAESALRNDVVSHAWAAGIWQFMPDTARRYGLQVNEFIDERYHFEKSTKAAIRYLQDLYNLFENWTLVAAAYNRWENGLRRDMQSQGVDNYYDLYLNEETSRYVFRILAIKYTLKSYFEKKWMIDTVIWWVYSRPKTQEIFVSGPIEDIVSWAQENNYIYKDIRTLNPWIRSTSLPEWEWYITVLDN